LLLLHHRLLRSSAPPLRLWWALLHPSAALLVLTLEHWSIWRDLYCSSILALDIDM
jgi:hypothetical protein